MRRRDNTWEGLIFRPILPKDIEQVKQLHTIFFPVQYGERFYTSLLRRDMFLTLLAADNDAIVGLITARIEYSESLFYDITGLNWCNRQREGYISTLGVVDSYRCKGLGTYLLEEMTKKLINIGCNDLSLHVKSDNETAIQFYITNGFEKRKFLKEYYLINGKYYDAYKMGRTISVATTNSSYFGSLWQWMYTFLPSVLKNQLSFCYM